MLKKRNSQPERAEQIKFVNWLRAKGFWVSASANGGKRHLLEAINLKRMGVAPGFPDIFVPISCGNYHGFFCEMKPEKGGKLSENQIDWLNYLREKNYFAEMAHGFEEAKELFLHYLSFHRPAA